MRFPQNRGPTKTISPGLPTAHSHSIFQSICSELPNHSKLQTSQLMCTDQLGPLFTECLSLCKYEADDMHIYLLTRVGGALVSANNMPPSCATHYIFF